MSRPGFRHVAVLLGMFTLPGLPTAQTPEGAELVEWKWGTPFEDLEADLGLKLLGTDRAAARYSSTLRRVASIPVTECLFEFVHGRLSGFAFMTAGRVNSRRMLARIERTFGSGKEDPPVGFRWIAGESRISYNEDSLGDAYIYCYSLTLQDHGADEVRRK